MKKGLLLKSLCILVVSMFVFSSCDDDDDEIKIDPALALAESSHVFANEEGDYALAVFANAAWTLTQEGDWFSVDKTSGTGNAVVKVKATANTTAGERTGKITVKSEGLSDQVFQITQQKEDVVLKVLGEDAYLIKPEGGIMKITVEANVNYTYEMSEWVKVEAAGYSASQSEISLNIEPNFWGSTRTATVVIKNAKDQKVVKTITLTQESVVAEVQEKIQLDGRGGRTVVPFSNVTNWDIVDDDPEAWLICNQTDDGFIIVAEKNEEAQRYLALTFMEKETGFRKLILVEQELYIDFNLSTDPGSLSSPDVSIQAAFEESSFRRFVKNNVYDDSQFSVSTEDTWIHPSIDENTNTITIAVDKNEGEAREGDVEVKSMYEGLVVSTKKIHVSQAKEVVEPYINVSETEHEFEFYNSGDTFEVTVDANVDWEITKYQEDKRITYVIEGNKIIFTYTQNNGPITVPFEFAVHRVGFTPTSDELCKMIRLTTTRP